MTEGKEDKENREKEKHECYWKRRCAILQRRNLRLHGENNRLKQRVKKMQAHENDEITTNALEVQPESIPNAVPEFF